MTEGPEDDFKDAKVAGYVGAILFGVSCIAFLVMLGIAIGVTIHENSQTGRAPAALLIAIPFLVLCTGAFALLGSWSLRKLRLWKRLETRPDAAWGTVGEVRSSPTKVNTRRLYVFTVTVTPTDGPPYEAEAKWFFPTDLQTVVTPGTMVALRVDPDDRRKVVIDWPQSRAAWAAKPAAPDAIPPSSD